MTDLMMSACIELLFAENRPAVEDRVYAAAAAGCDGIEMWTWRDKPLDAIAEAVADTGVAVPMMIVQPQGHLVDPARRVEFVIAVRESAEAAVRIGCRALVAVSGQTRPNAPSAEQDEAIVGALRAAAPIAADHGLELLLEPLNTGVDHPGCYLSGTAHGLELVERVGHPRVRLLLDVYHSTVMGEVPTKAIDGRGELVGHVHVADTDGRHEPGTGRIDWHETVVGLVAAGYRGFIGLEYVPTVDSARSIQVISEAVAAAGAPPAS